MSRTMKPKAKLKKKDGRLAKMKLSSGDASISEASDLSQLRKPVDINLSSLKQVAQLFEKGSDEVKALLTYECDVVYECRNCRSLFRSLANFISHKRVYCLERHGVTSRRRDIDRTIRDKDLLARSELSVDREHEENRIGERILRSQSSQNNPKNDLTGVDDARMRDRTELSDFEVAGGEKQSNALYHISNDDGRVLLEVIDSKRAAYQTVLRPDDSAPNDADLMKTQTLELTNMLNRNTAVLGPDGQLFEVGDVSGSDGQCLDQSDFATNVDTSADSELVCTICSAKFSTKKTLAFHIKSKHVPHRMCYPCPCCSSTFTNSWSVYRHLCKVHRKSNYQVRRLRAQIQARAFKRNLSRLDRVQRESASNKPNVIHEQRINDDTQEWMENLELDAELQRCGGCSKRFERKAALISHVQVCQKRGIFGESREAPIRRKRARKMPPKRIADYAEAQIKAVEASVVESPISTSPEESATPIVVEADDPEIPEQPTESRKSESPPIRRDSKETSSNGSLQSSPIKNKSESSMSDGRREKEPSSNGESKESTIAANDEPMEISIRVEDVSSLSKDVWDKMGESETGNERDQLDSSRSIVASPREPSPILVSTDTKKDSPTPTAASDIPEVIYTSIDNSLPVTLSGLDTEQKLGIQYRGIRLPTVTLEKINIPRSHVNLSNLEPSVSLKIGKERCVPVPKLRQPPQFCKWQCLPCDRKFASPANLRRHIALHMRRDRYRCRLCDDFKSLLKCDVVAHCNMKHNAKNNRAALADLVVEVPLTNDSYQMEKMAVDNARKICEDLKVTGVDQTAEHSFTIDSTCATPTNEIPISEETLISDDQTITTNITNSVEDVKPTRGRPPNGGRRGRKRRRGGFRKRIPRHVSPPRLTDEFDNEINDISISIDHSSEPKSDEFSRIRAPSRLDRDSELRKMVMEVIFGSADKDARDYSQQPDDRRSNCVNDDFDEALEHQENLGSSEPRGTIDDEIDVRAIVEKPDDLVSNGGNNNVFAPDYRSYKLKTIAIDRDVNVFPNNPDFTKCQMSVSANED